MRLHSSPACYNSRVPDAWDYKVLPKTPTKKWVAVLGGIRTADLCYESPGRSPSYYASPPIPRTYISIINSNRYFLFFFEVTFFFTICMPSAPRFSPLSLFEKVWKMGMYLFLFLNLIFCALCGYILFLITWMKVTILINTTFIQLGWHKYES